MSLDASNPFAAPSTLPYAFPPFDAIRHEHYRPAFDAGVAEHRAEIAAITAQDGAGDLRQHHRGAGALRPAAGPDHAGLLRDGQLDGHPGDAGARGRADARVVRPQRRDPARRRRSSPGSTPCTPRGTTAASTRSRCGSWSGTTPTSCAPAPRCRSSTSSGCASSTRRSARRPRSSARPCWPRPTRRPCTSPTRPSSPASPTTPSRRPRSRPRSATSTATSSPCCPRRSSRRSARWRTATCAAASSRPPPPAACAAASTTPAS